LVDGGGSGLGGRDPDLQMRTDATEKTKPANSGGEKVVVTGALDGEGGRHALWVFDVRTKSWTVVRPPPEFAGFVFSVASVRI